MIRVVLWLLPCILLMAGWAGWRLWSRRRARNGQMGGNKGEATIPQEPLLAWLIAVMVIYLAVLGGLAIMNLLDGRTHYTPSRYEQGRIVPGTVDQ